MTGSAGLVVNLNVTPDDRGAYWAGWIEGMGTYAYASDRDGLLSVAQEMFQLLADSFDSKEELLAYLKRRNIAHSPAEPSKVPVLV